MCLRPCLVPAALLAPRMYVCAVLPSLPSHPSPAPPTSPHPPSVGLRAQAEVINGHRGLQLKTDLALARLLDAPVQGSHCKDCKHKEGAQSTKRGKEGVKSPETGIQSCQDWAQPANLLPVHFHGRLAAYRQPGTSHYEPAAAMYVQAVHAAPEAPLARAHPLL